MSLVLPRRAFVLASSASLASVGALGGCCRSDFRSTCETRLNDLDAMAARAPTSLIAPFAAERAALRKELAATAPGEPGMEARKALAARLSSAIVTWDKRIDEALRVPALKQLIEGRWIGKFWRDGATHLGTNIHIKPDGVLANTRKGSKKLLVTVGGPILYVRGGELVYKDPGYKDQEIAFPTDGPPRPLVGGALGFVHRSEKYLLVPGS